MPVTSPDSISYPDTSWTGGFIAAIAATVTSIQAAFSKRGRKSYQWADATARGAQVGMANGDTGYQVDTGVLYRYNGSAWRPWSSEWTSYTATLTNITAGNGTVVTEYKYFQGRVVVRYAFTLGSTSAMGATPTISLPVNSRAIAWAFYTVAGSGGVLDSSAGSAPSSLHTHRFSAAQTGAIPATILTNTAGTLANISSTVPMTWAVADVLFGDFIYDPA